MYLIDQPLPSVAVLCLTDRLLTYFVWAGIFMLFQLAPRVAMLAALLVATSRNHVGTLSIGGSPGKKGN